ncbi:MAG: hypothetical protein OEY25_14395, partial [Candidatus Aminicenantes bacterium]|nr:hypothetical protein [Candidatus Aminicenantes bacterium]
MKRFIVFFGFSLIILASALIYAQALPDLDLQNVSCLKGKLYFVVINRGASLPAGWRAVADVYFDGAKKGHIDLGAPTSRTGGGIENSGGTSSYLTAFDITAPVTVDINIDPTNSIKESNEGNNFRRGAHLQPCGEVGLPDLDLQNVSCLKGKLYFVVINRGASLPAGWRAVADVYFDGA